MLNKVSLEQRRSSRRKMHSSPVSRGHTCDTGPSRGRLHTCDTSYTNSYSSMSMTPVTTFAMDDSGHHFSRTPSFRRSRFRSDGDLASYPRVSLSPSHNSASSTSPARHWDLQEGIEVSQREECAGVRIDIDVATSSSSRRVSEATDSTVIDRAGSMEHAVADGNIDGGRLKSVTLRWMNGADEIFEGDWETVLQVKLHLVEKKTGDPLFLSDIAILSPDYEVLSDDAPVLPRMAVVLKELKKRANLQEWKDDIVMHYKAEGVNGLKRIGRQVEKDGLIDVADVFERQRGFRVFIALQNGDPNRLCELVGFESHINLLGIYTLVAAKGDPNVDIGGSVLMHAIHESNSAAVDFLINHGTDVNKRGSHWCSESILPLHTATDLAAFGLGDVNIIRSLLDAKASVHSKGSNGKTVIQHFLENSRWFLRCKKPATNRRPTEVAEMLQQALETEGDSETLRLFNQGNVGNIENDDAQGMSPKASADSEIETSSIDNPIFNIGDLSLLGDRDDQSYLFGTHNQSRRSSVYTFSADGRATPGPSRRASYRTASAPRCQSSHDGRLYSDDIIARLHQLDRRISERRDSEVQSYNSVEHASHEPQSPLIDNELLARLQDLDRRISERDTEMSDFDVSTRRSSICAPGCASSHDEGQANIMRHLLQRTVLEDGLGYPHQGRCTLERARNEVAMVLQQALETSTMVLEEALEKTEGKNI